MASLPREILICQDDDGREAFTEWLRRLVVVTRGRIRVRFDRLEDGNFGDVKPVGEGVSELRIPVGPGYRVYFGQVGREVHLICGGSKQSQSGAIAFAINFWRQHD